MFEVRIFEGGATMKLTYWSHSCVLLETNGHRLVVDPFLTGNPLAPVGLGVMMLAMLYAACYTAFFLAAACQMFKRKSIG